MKISDLMLNIVGTANDKFSRVHPNGGVNIGVGYGGNDEGIASWVVVLRRLPQHELDRGVVEKTSTIYRMEFEMSFRRFNPSLLEALKDLQSSVECVHCWEEGQE